MNYEDLIGKEVIVTAKQFHNHTLVVSAIDPDIGITLHAKDDVEKQPVMCLCHPDLHFGKHKLEWESDDEHNRWLEWYAATFDHWLFAAHNGVIDDAWDAKDMDIAIQRTGGPIGSSFYTAEQMCLFR